MSDHRLQAMLDSAPELERSTGRQKGDAEKQSDIPEQEAALWPVWQDRKVDQDRLLRDLDLR
jgi:hypothetical protein